MTSSTQVTVNEAIVELDKLLVGLNMLYEEITTRKENILSEVDIKENLKEQLYSRDFRNHLIELIQNNYGEVFYRDVAHQVMQNIDNDIEAFINSRVNAALTAAGVTPQR